MKVYVPTLGVEIDPSDLVASEVAESAELPTVRREYMRYELWLKIGQSNSVGTDGTGPVDIGGLDAPDSRVWEISRGADKSTYLAAPAGEAHILRHPAQDDSSGIGFSQWFGKRRVANHDGIERLVICNRGVGGTGFNGNRWNPGDDLYLAALNEVLAFLGANPEYTFMGIIWHQGESDAGSATYAADLVSMVDAYRAAIPGGDASVFVPGTMLSTWIGADAGRLAIDAVHRDIGNLLSRATVADFADLTNAQDSIHFGTDDLRTMGARYADAVDTITITAPPAASQDLLKARVRMQVRDGVLWDVWGSGMEVPGAIVQDDRFGAVWDSEGAGANTPALLNAGAYTKMFWIKANAAVSGFGNILSGSLTGAVATGHYFGHGGLGHAGSAIVSIPAMQAAIDTLQWVHVAVTYDGAEWRVYLDGVLDAGSPVANGAPLGFDPIVQFGRFGAANPIDALLHDVIILPTAAPASYVAKVFADAPL